MAIKKTQIEVLNSNIKEKNINNKYVLTTILTSLKFQQIPFYRLVYK
jgi:hypothetical protein